MLRILTDLVALISSHGVNFPHYLGHHPGVLIDIWAHWDTQYYTAIARHGYPLTLPIAGVAHVLPRTAAFAPAYPAIIGAVHSWFGFNYVAAGQFVSAVFCIIALTGVVYVISKEAGRSVGGSAAFLLVAFPTGFFLLGDYPESMALALVVWGFVALRSRRWLLAGLAAGLAFLTVFYLAIFLIPCGVEFLRHRHHRFVLWRLAHRRRRLFVLVERRSIFERVLQTSWTTLAGWLYPIVALVTPTIVALVCWLNIDKETYGDPLAFVHVQRDWGRRFSTPWHLIAHTAMDFAHLRFLDTATQSVMEFYDAITVVALIALTVLCFWRFRLSWGLWLTGALAVFTFQSTLYSETREVLVLFPFFAAISRFTTGHPWRERFLLACFIPGGYYLVWRFVTGRFAG